MAAGEANPGTWGTRPSPRCHPDLPGLKEAHSARPLSVSRPLSLSPIITPMTDRQAFPFDGAGGILEESHRAAVMIRHHVRVCVSNDVCVWVPPGELIFPKGARWWFWSSLMMKMMSLATMMKMITLAKCARDVWCVRDQWGSHSC